MKTASSRTTIVALLTVAALGACSTAGTPAPGPSGPGGPGGSASPVQPGARAGTHTQADAGFVRGMLAHHAQALVMTALVPSRTTRQEIRLLAERIEVSQRDEIRMMENWLRARGEPVPAAAAHAQHHGSGAHAQMPGMLTEQELARLAAARGAEFDRLFLEFMIRHHEGAIVMVQELFAAPGAGQGSQIFQIASEVEADQRMEIERMRRLLGTL